MHLPTEKTLQNFLCWNKQRISGVNYILVADSEEDDGEALILKEIFPKDGEEEALYEIVDDDDELNAVARVFQEMLDDVESRINMT